MGAKEEIKILNGYLDAIQGNIFGIQKEFALRNEPITAEQVKAQILQKTCEEQYTLLEVYKDHNAQFEKLVGLEFSGGTFKNSNLLLNRCKHLLNGSSIKKMFP